MKKCTSALGTTFLALTALTISAAPSAADDIAASAPHLSPDQRAIAACVSSMVSKMLPAEGIQIRTVVPPGQARVFSALDASNRESTKVMKLAMTAYGVGNGKALANAECTVGADAQVIELSVSAINRARLKQFALSDLRITIAGG